MVYGPISTRRKLPEQNFETVLLMADRFDRSSFAQQTWAKIAKECVEMVEGKQWSEADLKTLEDEGRPGLTFNKIGPLVRIVLGYHRNNRTDEKYLPSHDDASTVEIATAITKTAKQISEAAQQPYIDTEVFMDGIITGRGYYDWRLNFEENELGEAMSAALDPFATYLDPDADQYDLNKGSYVMTSRWASLDDIEGTYGLPAKRMVEPLVMGGQSGMPAVLTQYAEELTPWRKFGGDEDSEFDYSFGSSQGFLHNITDQGRKTVRVLEMQHYKRTKTRLIVDLETGMLKPLPDHWDFRRIQRFMEWQEERFARLGKTSPIRFDERMIRRVKWTTMVGDFLVYDDWSPYKTFTIIPYFPYFRRGKTRGMVEDLLDPQREINKRRSAQIDQVTRSANSGWILHEQGLDVEQEENWENNSAAPGFIGKWRGEAHMKPERITQGAQPIAAEKLEMKAADDLKEISGINEELLGQVDKVQSGRAIEAKQRQGVMAIQTYMDNMSRTKELGGRKKLELIQNHYTEQRMVRILGEDGEQDMFIINERQPLTGSVLNNVSLGKYSLSIDETPLSASFLAAQWEELMEMIEKGVLPVEAVMDIAVELSTVPQKEMIKQRIQGFMRGQGIPVGDDVMQQAGGAPIAGAPQGAPQGALPAPQGNVVPMQQPQGGQPR